MRHLESHSPDKNVHKQRFSIFFINNSLNMERLDLFSEFFLQNQGMTFVSLLSDNIHCHLSIALLGQFPNKLTLFNLGNLTSCRRPTCMCTVYSVAVCSITCTQQQIQIKR